MNLWTSFLWTVLENFSIFYTVFIIHWTISRRCQYLVCRPLALNDRVIDELDRIWSEAMVAKSRYYHEIFLEGLRKPCKTSVQIGDVPTESRF
jgi:hypothetical protein